VLAPCIALLLVLPVTALLLLLAAPAAATADANDAVNNLSALGGLGAILTAGLRNGMPLIVGIPANTPCGT
jgi:hypothetical protein